MSTDQHTEVPGQAMTVARFAERLNAVLDELTDPATLSLSSEETGAALLGLARAKDRLDALYLHMLAVADNKDVRLKDASATTGAWLAHQTRLVRRTANRLTRLAKELDGEFTATRAAMAYGRVNLEQAAVIVAAIKDLPEDIDGTDRRRGEAHLIAKCAEHDAKDIERLGQHLLEVLAPEEADRRLGAKLAEAERRARMRTRLTLRNNGDSTYTGRFTVPQLHGLMLKRILDAIIAPRRVGKDKWTDRRGQRIAGTDMMGRGFCEMLERFPANRLPKACGMNATVVVTTSLVDLQAGLGLGTLSTGEKLSPGSVRRLACQAGVIPSVLGTKSEVLDLGRTARFHSRAQRLAKEIEQRECTAEGCDRPAPWCDLHHEVEWSRGGHTNVRDARLLCPWHHHRAHDPAYDMRRMPDGQVRFQRRQ